MLNFTKILNTSSLVRKFWKAPDEFNTIFQIKEDIVELNSQSKTAQEGLTS